MGDNAKTFYNPYDFVPMPRKKARHTEEEGERLSGYIEYELTTKTPLFIPNTSSKKAFSASDEISEHASMDFYSYELLDEKERYDDKYHTPVIPGSAIRGLLRNVYETLTDSCYSAVNDEAQLFKRTSDAYKPGLIKRMADGKFALYAAEEAIFAGTDSRLRDGAKVYFSVKQKVESQNSFGRRNVPTRDLVDEILDKPSRDAYTGYAKKGERDIRGREGKWHLFRLKNSAKAVKDDISLELEGLELVLRSYADPRVNKKLGDGPQAHKGYASYSKAFESFKQNSQVNDCFPVYYSMVVQDKIYYLSPAAITKEAYQTKVRNVLEKRGLHPCQERSDACPTCAMFGFVGKDNEVSRSSQIRVLDASVRNPLENESSYYVNKWMTLNELSSPKISSTEFYLRKPSPRADFWTYDYYYEGGVAKPNLNPELSGRKMYWHYEPKLSASVEKTKRNVTVRMLKENVVFVGKVYFDSISRKQLERLIWICNISKETTYGYKLGMGKPLGLGSIAMEVKDVKLRRFGTDIENIYSVESVEHATRSYGELEYSTSAEKKFLKMCDMSDMNTKNVRYPYAYNEKGEEGETFLWFALNHGGGMKKRKDYKIQAGGIIESARLDNPLAVYRKAANPRNSYGGDRRNNGYSGKGGSHNSHHHNNKRR